MQNSESITTTAQTVGHTPGPWSVKPSSHRQEFAAFVMAGVRGIAAVENNENRGSTGAEDEANAHLIAAAPELLAALIALEKAHTDLMADRGCGEVYPSCVSEERFEEIIHCGETARAAIAKATS
jgi:hypothetical protein